jgi:hypothetical protein
LNKPRKFQAATVDAAWRQLSSKSGSQRFLVADEVGLGKTIIAQQVLRRLIEAKSPSPAVVLYVCGSLPLASQNSTKLLDALDDNHERAKARSTVDRLTMVPLRDWPSSRSLHLYALTPTTSLPQLKGPQHGRKEERALLEVLAGGIGSELVAHISRAMFQWTVRNYYSFDALVAKIERDLKAVWHERFQKATRKVFGIAPGTRLLPALLAEGDRRLLFKGLRQSLAVAVLDQLSPDLVIFDEFHGYSERLTSPDEPILVKRLRGDEGDGDTPVLLLSATPYKMHTSRSEDPAGTGHRQSLMELFGYLFGKGLRGARGIRAAEQVKTCHEGFREIHVELWSGRPDSERARDARQKLQSTLARIMSRTERYLHPLGKQGQRLGSIMAPVEPADVQSFLGLATKTGAYENRSVMADAVAIWSSVPLPLQSLSTEYQLQRKVTGPPPKDTPQLRNAMVKNLRPLVTLPHPRLRALSNYLPPEKLAIPWIAPSLPWWELGGRWAKEPLSSKLLLFSHYRATPPAVAGLLSYGVETVFPSLQNHSAAAVLKKRSLRVSEERGLGLIALFHTSEWLISKTDPTEVFAGGEQDPMAPAAVEKLLVRQVRQALREKGIRVRRRKASRPLWKLLARIESDAQDHLSAWEGLSDGEAGLSRIADRWRSESSEPLDWVSESELHTLARHALRAPGVVLGRAVRRHAPRTSYDALFMASWTGLRTYLDRPWFNAALRRRRQKFVKALEQAVFDGNLESVLDEHLWLERTLNPPREENELAKKLLLALSRVRGSARFLHLDQPLRCHAAMPFSTASVGAEPEAGEGLAPRPDEIRRGFNSPFWPYVLATTSVGQEGLDFHYWCRTVVHWDLCSSPVELEQREGRVQRFAGLSVRQAIAGTARAMKVELEVGTSPWKQLEKWAEQNLSDESGLRPWWLHENAETESLMFETPGSDQVFRRERLQQRRLRYRLTLGQPNQADLLDLLTQDTSLTTERIQQALLDLSAYSSSRETSRFGLTQLKT